MRGIDSSVGGIAVQFHTPRWAMETVSADDRSQFVSFVLCDFLVAAEGGLKP